MRMLSNIAVVGIVVILPALAADNRIDALINSGPRTTSIPMPDPMHIPMVFGKDIQWKGESGERQALLFGDPDKAGIYGG